MKAPTTRATAPVELAEQLRRVADMLASPKLAYSIREAAEATGYGETVIKDALRDGLLTARYANSKPVIPTTELLDWLANLPTDKP